MSEAVGASRNHLVIGLGGTGGRVIRALRRRIWQLYRQHSLADVHLEYLYVDSSAEMMRDDDPSWRVLGENAQLPRGSRLLIGGARVWNVLDNRRAFPAIAPWIGDRRSWEQVPQNIIDAGAGGQRRRLGRFLFAMKAPQFQDDVRSLYARLRSASNDPSVHIHLVTGLAGGTGGGSFIDALVMLANDRQGLGQDVKLSLLALLPEQGSRWNNGNYYANGYAALRELNALLIGGERAYKPYDLTGNGQRRALPPERMAGVYLCTNENSAGRAIDVEREAPPMIADFLLERIAESGRQSTPIFTNENRDLGPEVIPGTRIGVRARSFFAFGIKRVEYPQEEIEEYLTFCLVRSAVQALLYNNWSEAFGYADRPVPTNYRARATDPEFLVQWMLTDACLRAEQPVLADEGKRAERDRWAPDFLGEWTAERDHAQKQCAEQNYGRSELLPAFSQLMDSAYEQGFRMIGVPSFFAGRQRAPRVTAQAIRERLEQDLLRRWREGQPGWSLDDVAATLEALRSTLADRAEGFAVAVDTARKRIDEAGELMEEVVGEAARIGFAFWPLRRSGVLNRYAEQSLEYYLARTDLLASQVALELIPVVQQELAALETQVGALRQLINSALQDALAKTKAGMNAASGGVIEADRYFDPARVAALAEQITHDRAEMTRLAATIQQMLLDTPRIREHSTFATIIQEFSEEALGERVFKVCNEQVYRIHDRFAPNEGERVLGIRLLARLRADLAGDGEKMKSFVRGLVDKARPFVRYDDAQRRMAPEAVGAPPEATSGAATTVVIVQRPHPPELDAFGRRLDDAFHEATLSIHIPKDTTSRDNAITVISLDAKIPARYLSLVGFLRDEYVKRLAGPSPVGRLEVHSEDDAAELPDLFPEVTAPKKAGAYLLIARALNLVLEDKDETGRRQVVLRYTKDGFTYRDRLATTFDELPEQLGQSEFVMLESQTKARLGAAEMLHIDQRKRVFEQVAELVRTVERERGDHSEIYARTRDDALQARQLLNIEG